MNVIRFQAWGAIDVEAMPRNQRRAHLNHIKGELKELGLGFLIGGQPPEHAFYKVYDLEKTEKMQRGKDVYDANVVYGVEHGTGALTRICRWLVDNKDPANKEATHETTA